MAWIQTIDENTAEGELAEVYEKISSARGKLSNIMRVHSLNPKAMDAHMELYLSIMFSKTSLNRSVRELIAVVVSVANGCDYCVGHHAEALNFYWKDHKRIEALIENYNNAGLTVREMVICEYSDKLTRNPDAVQKADVEKLRDSGLSDEDILGVNLIVSYFNFVNRIALGLGVETSIEEIGGYKY